MTKDSVFGMNKDGNASDRFPYVRIPLLLSLLRSAYFTSSLKIHVDINLILCMIFTMTKVLPICLPPQLGWNPTEDK
jgi:hypothetical protein